jgi:hypothetical protein
MVPLELDIRHFQRRRRRRIEFLDLGNEPIATL